MRLAATILTAFALTACTSAQEITQRDSATCTSWGAQPGSENYFPCMALLQQERSIQIQRTAVILQSAGRGFSSYSSEPRAFHTPTVCHSQRNGTGYETVCN